MLKKKNYPILVNLNCEYKSSFINCNLPAVPYTTRIMKKYSVPLEPFATNPAVCKDCLEPMANNDAALKFVSARFLDCDNDELDNEYPAVHCPMLVVPTIVLISAFNVNK